jgi:hypothetical protein
MDQQNKFWFALSVGLSCDDNHFIRSEIPMTNETLVDQIAEERTCANCACSIIQEAPTLGKQLFCRLNPAIGKMVRTQVPRIIKGQPQVRDGKPVMEQGEALGFMFAPTMATLVCFDGWRPLGTLPGDFTYRSSDIERRFGAGLDRLLNDMKEDAALQALAREPMTEAEERQSMLDSLGNDVDPTKN